MLVALAAASLILVLVAGQAAVLARNRSKQPAEGPGVAAPAPSRPAPTDPLGRVIDVLRRRRWVRRALSVASVLAMLGAVSMVGYPFYTNLVQSRIQARLDRQLASPELRQAYLERRIQEGDSLTRIRIPDIGVDVVVVEGTTDKSLRAGAGHYRSTPLPCERGNVGIAGHRTTYGRPFANLDLLEPGDQIVLETPIGSCEYRVSRDPFITKPSDMTVIEPTPVPSLTLTTCHPKGSARQRLIVRAELVLQPTSPAG
jgi:sortase A